MGNQTQVPQNQTAYHGDGTGTDDCDGVLQGNGVFSGLDFQCFRILLGAAVGDDPHFGFQTVDDFVDFGHQLQYVYRCGNAQLLGGIGDGGVFYLFQCVDACFHFGSTVGAAQTIQQENLLGVYGLLGLVVVMLVLMVVVTAGAGFIVVMLVLVVVVAAGALFIVVVMFVLVVVVVARADFTVGMVMVV